MPTRRAVIAALLTAGAFAVCTGCGSRTDENALPDLPPGVTLASFALDGASEDPTPAQVDEAVLALAEAHPDLLAIHLAHPDTILAPLLTSCRERMPHLTFRETVTPGDGAAALLLLSRYPIVARRSAFDLTYRIGDRHHRIDPGMLDVDVVVDPYGLIRVVTARLKDKVFHVSGQTEMRRNEARILARRLRGGHTADNRLLLVAATLNDTPDSAPVREIVETGGQGLKATRPLDTRGDAWTWRDPDRDRYERSDYVLVSPGLGSFVVEESALILDTPEVRAVSSHRPLIVRLARRDRRASDSD